MMLQKVGQLPIFRLALLIAAHLRQSLLHHLEHHPLADIFGLNLVAGFGQFSKFRQNGLQSVRGSRNEDIMARQVTVGECEQNTLFLVGKLCGLPVEFLKKPGRKDVDLLLQFEDPLDIVAGACHFIYPNLSQVKYPSRNKVIASEKTRKRKYMPPAITNGMEMK